MIAREAIAVPCSSQKPKYFGVVAYCGNVVQSAIATFVGDCLCCVVENLWSIQSVSSDCENIIDELVLNSGDNGVIARRLTGF